MSKEYYPKYLNLTESLLRCRNDKELSAILNTNQNLIDSELIKTMLQMAADLRAVGKIDVFNQLITIAIYLLITIGNYFLKNQEISKAREFYEQGLPIAKQIDTKVGKILEVDILNALGNSYNRPHDWNLDKAIDVCKESLDIARAVGYLHGEAVALICIGKACCWYPGEKRNFPKAIECYEQAKVIFEETNNFQGVLEVLWSLQDCYYYTADYDKAIKTNNQLLEIARKNEIPLLEVSSLFYLGSNHRSLGKIAEARRYYEQSLQLAKRIDIEVAGSWQVRSLEGLGSYYTTKGNLAEAKKYYQESLNIAEKINDRQGQANALEPLAKISYYQGNSEMAWSYNEQSLKIKQELQDQIGIGNSIGFRGDIYQSQGNYTDALKNFEQCLQIMRQVNNTAGEASTLTDIGVAYLGLGQIEQAKSSLDNGIKLWESVRGKLGDDDFKVSIFEQQARTYHLLQFVLINQEKPLAALEIAERGKARALVELLSKGLDSQLTEQTTITAPTLQQIQQIAQEQNATLVEYSILWSRTLLIWVIKPSGEIAFHQVDIAPLLQEFNTSLEKLVAIARQLIGVRETRFVDSAENEDYGEVDRGDNKRLDQLYQILIEPIADLLPKDADERVIFIPQNSLFLVPFPALKDASGKYLIERHTILTAPSIQVLELTRKHQQRVQEVTGNDALLVGNPTMPSFKSRQLSSLPGAQQEARDIAPLLKTKALIGDEATKVAILERMPTAKIIHLATHGLLDEAEESKVPGAIALAPSRTDKGWLTATEIINLKMLKAELVVLSACNTGQGRLTGDGVIGLSRSFISRGVPSVVASLWSVPDAPTAPFMVEFYQNLQRGLDKAQALRQAMLTIMAKHPNPANWAAFTLIGEAEQALFQETA